MLKMEYRKNPIPKLPTPPNAEQIRTLDTAVRSLNTLILKNVFSELITDDLAEEFDTRAAEIKKARAAKGRALYKSYVGCSLTLFLNRSVDVHKRKRFAGTLWSLPPCDVWQAVEEITRESSESSCDQIIRYFGTFTAWCSATTALVGANCELLLVYRVNVPHLVPAVSNDIIANFKNRYKAALKPQSEPTHINQRNSALAFIDSLKLTPNMMMNVAIHAESSLLALGCNVVLEDLEHHKLHLTKYRISSR